MSAALKLAPALEPELPEEAPFHTTAELIEQLSEGIERHFLRQAFLADKFAQARRDSVIHRAAEMARRRIEALLDGMTKDYDAARLEAEELREANEYLWHQNYELRSRLEWATSHVSHSVRMAE